MKRLLMVAAAVVVLGVGAVALGGAVTSAQEGDGPFRSILGRVADKLGVSEEELQAAFDEARSEAIDDAVAEGSLTEEQAARLRERAEEGLFPFGGERFHPRPGACHRGAGLILEAASQVLDIPKEELVEQLQDGASLAEIAEAQGLTGEEFEADLLAQIQVLLGEKVASGDLTQEQADRIFQGIEENIDRIVNAHPHPRLHGRCRPRNGPLWEGASEDVEADEVTA